MTDGKTVEECVAEYRRKKITAYNRAYYAANRERLNAYQRAYRAAKRAEKRATVKEAENNGEK